MHHLHNSQIRRYFWVLSCCLKVLIPINQIHGHFFLEAFLISKPMPETPGDLFRFPVLLNHRSNTVSEESQYRAQASFYHR